MDCDHLQETAAINCSLLALQKIIENKATNGGAYVNFRESVLTRLLKDCFGGNSKTALLATVASNPEHRAIKVCIVSNFYFVLDLQLSFSKNPHKILRAYKFSNYIM